MGRLVGQIMADVKEISKAAVRRMARSGKKDVHLIPLRDLREATGDFLDRNVIGTGGFGKVYLGILEDGTKVAVKRGHKKHDQGAAEFKAEKEVLFGLEHPNLVCLIGYCGEKGEMILVYEYMEEGTLESHLYGSDKVSLIWDWEPRLKVCVGAAKGLYYLHSSPPDGIIHRDIKPANILLDGNLCAKIGDLGISRTGPKLHETHVSTRVGGTPGYFDPEYLLTGMLTVKSDVYSFGVVLLQVLCGRAVIDLTLSEEKKNLVCWGKKMLEEGNVAEIVDEKIRGTIHPHNLAMFGDIVLRCLAEKGAQRPTMEEVLRDLEWELDCVRAEEEVAAGNSGDEFGHAAVSSQGIMPEKKVKTLERCQGKTYERRPSVSHDLFAPSTSRAGNSGDDESGHAAVSSQEIMQEKKIKALERCQGKTYERNPSVSRDPSAPWPSRPARLSLLRRNGDAMKMKGPVELETISEDENSE